jgi:hypothetical protein
MTIWIIRANSREHTPLPHHETLIILDLTPWHPPTADITVFQEAWRLQRVYFILNLKHTWRPCLLEVCIQSLEKKNQLDLFSAGT